MNTRLFLIVASIAFACTAAGGGCTPAERAELGPAVVPLERSACILLRAVTTSGAVDEVCANADELAPFVSELVAAQAPRSSAPGVRSLSAPKAKRVPAFAMPLPSYVVEPQRCAQWVSIGGDGGR